MKKLCLICFFFFLGIINIKAEEIINIDIYQKKIDNLTYENASLKDTIIKLNDKIKNLNDDLNYKINLQNQNISYLANVNNENVKLYQNDINKLDILLDKTKKEKLQLQEQLDVCLDSNVYIKDSPKPKVICIVFIIILGISLFVIGIKGKKL